MKEYLDDNGFTSAEMQKDFWPKLRKSSEEKEMNFGVPPGHQLIDYHNTGAGKKRVIEIKEKWENETTHCLVLGTSYFSQNWEGFQQLVEDLSDKKLLKKKFWKIFTFHKNSDAKKNWPDRLINIEKTLKNLIKKFEKKNKITFDFEPLPYSEPKEKLLDD